MTNPSRDFRLKRHHLKRKGLNFWLQRGPYNISKGAMANFRFSPPFVSRRWKMSSRLIHIGILGRRRLFLKQHFFIWLTCFIAARSVEEVEKSLWQQIWIDWPGNTANYVAIFIGTETISQTIAFWFELVFACSERWKENCTEATVCLCKTCQLLWWWFFLHVLSILLPKHIMRWKDMLIGFWRTFQECCQFVHIITTCLFTTWISKHEKWRDAWLT